MSAWLVILAIARVHNPTTVLVILPAGTSFGFPLVSNRQIRHQNRATWQTQKGAAYARGQHSNRDSCINNDGAYGMQILAGVNTNGFAELVFTVGGPSDEPIAGDWNGLV